MELHPSVIAPIATKPTRRILTKGQCRIVPHPQEPWATRTKMSTKLTVSKFLTFMARPTQSIARLDCSSRDLKIIALRRTIFQIINGQKLVGCQQKLPKILKFYTNHKMSASRKGIAVRVRTSPEWRHEKRLRIVGEF